MSLESPTIIFLAAVLPAFLLIAFIYWKDKYQREPVGQIVKGLVYGFLSALIAIILETLLTPIIPAHPVTWLGAIMKGFVGAAMPEEFAKLLMLFLLLRNNKYFDEHFDGIVYAVCIGMGFAATENIVYLFSNINNWQSVAVSRAMFAVPGHFTFAVAMGYFYSMLFFRDMNAINIGRVFWVPVLLHGTYDSLLFMAQTNTMFAGILLVCFYFFCYRIFRWGIRRINEHLERDRELLHNRFGEHEIEDIQPVEEKSMPKRMFLRALEWIIGVLIFLLVLGVIATVNDDEQEGEEESEEIVIEETNLVTYPGRSINYSRKFSDNNPIQLTAARSVGLVTPPATRSIASTMIGDLDKVETGPNYVIDPLTHSVPYLVPVAKKRLDSIGYEFADILQRNGLPHYRFYVTSVLRTQEDIDALMRTNGNSTRNSCHNYGTTFDIAYFRYDKVTPTTDYMTEDNLKLVLGQVLLNQQRAGKIYVKYEYKQSCFHVTARK